MVTKSEPQRRSTIKDVAAEADVSISTVSLVMNERDGVSPDTRERVLQTAERLGYVPTGAARQLVTRRTGNIGFVVREDHFTRSEPFYTRVFLGTEFEARYHNQYVLLTTIPERYQPGTHTPRFLRERNIDGLLIAGKVDSTFLAEVREMDVPMVLVDYYAEGASSVMIDNQGGAREAVEHLISRGHRQIAFLGADLQHPSLKERLDGYRLALAGADISVDPSLLFLTLDGKPERAIGVELGRAVVASDATAVFCVNDALALGVLDVARQRGVVVPDELAVVGFDDVPGASDAMPPLTTVRVFKEQLGELALRRLNDLLSEEPEREPRYARSSQRIKISTELVVRYSSLRQPNPGTPEPLLPQSEHVDDQ